MVELIGRMKGALTPPPVVTVNLHQTTEYQLVISIVIEALQSFPDARASVIDALRVH